MPDIHPWTRGTLKGEALAGYESLDPAALPWENARLKKPLPEGFRLAKRSKSRWVVATEWNGATLYFKREIRENWQRRLSTALLGPKTRREWIVGRRFLERGILVPQPLLWAGDRDQSFLVTLAVPETWITTQDWIRDRSPESRRPRIARVAAYAATQHAVPAYHHDFRNNHVYWTAEPDTAPPLRQFGMIDLDGAFVGKPVKPARAREACLEFFRSFTKGSLAAEDVQAYADAYHQAGGCRLDPADIAREARQHP